MLKKILLALIFVITAITNVTHAEDDMKTVASKAYVDTKIETKQLKIPAAGQPNVGAGETVMTYTTTGNGQIGERGLYSDISSYDASTDGGKLITASALNATFTNLPTTDTTKLECANQADGCTLWTIVDQTAYGISGNGTTTIDLMSLIGNVAGTGYTSNDDSGSDYFTNGMSNSIISGDPLAFAVDYGAKGMIKGHGRCSMRAGDTHTWDNDTYNTISSNFTPTLPDASGDYCYCQLDGYTTNGDNWGNMTALSAPWVFYYDYGDTFSCVEDCAGICANRLWRADPDALAFRAAVFNSVQ